MQARTIEAPPAPPPSGQAPDVPAPPPVIVSTQQLSGSPRAKYEALRAKREVLGEYMSRLLNRRENIADRLNSPNVTPAEKAALEDHLRELNTRIIAMEKQLEASDAEVAEAAGVPGAPVPEPDRRPNGPPEEMLVIGTVFTGIALVLVAGAYARRLWKGAARVVTQIPAALEARLTRFEQSIDAVAIEVERIGEGQRFMTRLFTENGAPRGPGAGAAEPPDVGVPEAAPHARRGGS